MSEIANKSQQQQHQHIPATLTAPQESGGFIGDPIANTTEGFLAWMEDLEAPLALHIGLSRIEILTLTLIVGSIVSM